MTGLRYVPGDWLALVRREHVVLLPGDTPDEEIARLWEQTGGPATVESLLSSILSAANMQIASLPPFAIFSREAAPHVVVRGSLVFSATGEDGAERASGEGVATWQERRFQPADAWDVGVGGTAAGDAWLPIDEGIVRVGGLRCGSPETGAAGTRAVAAAAAPAESVRELDPDPEPEPAVPAAPEPEPALEPTVAATPEPGPAPEPEPDSDPEPERERESSPKPEPGDAHDHDADSISLEQISLAGELLGRRELESDTTDVSAPPADAAPAVDAEDADDADTVLVSRAPAPESSAPAPEPVALARAESADDPGMIDSVPWRTSSRAPAAPPVPPVPPTQPGPPVLAAAGADGDGDHDGHTVMRSDLPPVEPPAAEPEPAPSGEPDDALTLTSHNTTTGASTAEFVLGRACDEGHANPPTSSSCTVCGTALTGDAHQVIRPALGRMIVADGGGQRESEHELTRSVVLGRQPSARGFTGDQQPRLMQVSSPSGDISRSHLQVSVDGWHVELVDLGATNGTVLIRPGQAPRRLGKSESVLLLSGDVADLGDGVSLRFEDLP